MPLRPAFFSNATVARKRRPDSIVDERDTRWCWGGGYQLLGGQCSEAVAGRWRVRPTVRARSAFVARRCVSSLATPACVVVVVVVVVVVPVAAAADDALLVPLFARRDRSDAVVGREITGVAAAAMHWTPPDPVCPERWSLSSNASGSVCSFAAAGWLATTGFSVLSASTAFYRVLPNFVELALVLAPGFTSLSFVYLKFASIGRVLPCLFRLETGSKRQNWFPSDNYRKWNPLTSIQLGKALTFPQFLVTCLQSVAKVCLSSTNRHNVWFTPRRTKTRETVAGYSDACSLLYCSSWNETLTEFDLHSKSRSASLLLVLPDFYSVEVGYHREVEWHWTASPAVSSYRQSVRGRIALALFLGQVSVKRNPIELGNLFSENHRIRFHPRKHDQNRCSSLKVWPSSWGLVQLVKTT